MSRSSLSNYKGHRQYSESIKTRSNYMYLTQRAGKRVQVSHGWFWFSLLIERKRGRGFFCFFCFFFVSEPIVQRSDVI